MINILGRMNVPGWLIRIVMGFLREREIILRYKGYSSDSESLPGGGPQGTLLGLFLFLILINFAGLDQVEMNLGSKITQKANKRTPLASTHMKFVDDMSLAEAINLKDKLVKNSNPPRPLAFHERTEHILPSDKYHMQGHLNRLLDYCSRHEMLINGETSWD